MPLSDWVVDIMPAAENSQVFPLVDAWTTSNLHAGQFTAACGVYRYQSDLLASIIGDDFFACEPTGSLVQRYRSLADENDNSIVPPTERGREGVEFLASRDPWFRPVDLTDGPDGAMYIVDMHRAVIEHPEWVPTELKQRVDERYGDGAGRIYRIVPKQQQDRPDVVSIDKSDIDQLFAGLGNENRWTRTTVNRLIIEQLTADTDKGEREFRIDDCWSNSRQTTVKNENSTRLSSMRVRDNQLAWLSTSLKGVDIDFIERCFDHQAVGSRVQAVKLLAKPDPNDGRVSTLRQLMAADVSPRVRFQWLLEFAPTATAVDLALLQNIVKDSVADSAIDKQWIAKAIGLVSADISADFIATVLGSTDDHEQLQLLEPLVKRCGWSGSPKFWNTLLTNDRGAMESLLPVALEGLKFQRQRMSDLADQLSPDAEDSWRQIVELAIEVSLDDSLPEPERLRAMEVLAADGGPAVVQAAMVLLDEEAENMLLNAVELVAKSTNISETLLLGVKIVERIPQSSPAVSARLVQAVAKHSSWSIDLIDALESGQLPRSFVDPTSMEQLSRHPESSAREKIQKVIASGTEMNEALMATYVKALSADGDTEAGRALFRRHCVSCHRIESQGFVVGPDISDLRTQTPEQILQSILEPSAAIDANYFRYTVVTVDGRILEGLLIEQNSERITLQAQNEIRHVIPRDEIEILKSSGLSMMPTGFADLMSPRETGDLVTYLKRWRL